MNIQWITAPLIGALIGLVTNSVAIKMLFRPLKPIYIGKFKVPFTPGVIPKEKARIAKSIGAVVADELLTSSTLQEAMVNPHMKNHINLQVEHLYEKYKDSNQTVQELLLSVSGQEALDEIFWGLNKHVVQEVTHAVKKEDWGSILVEFILEEVVQKLNPMLRAVAGGAVEASKEPVAKKINAVVEEKADGLIEEFVDKKMNDILNCPMSDLASKAETSLPAIKEAVFNAYESFVTKKLSDILDAIDIRKVIQDKIESLDLLKMEELIMSIMRKELNMLIWLGGLLGLLMGFVNLIF